MRLFEKITGNTEQTFSEQGRTPAGDDGNEVSH